MWSSVWKLSMSLFCFSILSRYFIFNDIIKYLLKARNVFSISTLIIPKQTATSDTCTMTNEEELIDYAEERGLIMLGWIHVNTFLFGLIYATKNS